MRPGRSSSVAVTLAAIAACAAGCTWHGATAITTSGSTSTAPATSTATAPAPGGPCGSTAEAPARYDHVVWIVMENHGFDEAVDPAQAPYTAGLATACGLATAFTAETHPSLPNYIAMTSGSTQGVHDDDGPDAHPLGADSIFSQTGGDWRALEESMPAPCARGNAGEYAVRHNPAVYYTSIVAECATRDVPLGDAPDLSARFTFVTPNLRDDTHDASVAVGDAWLATFVPKVLASPEYRAGRTALFLTWDENDGSAGNRIATLVVAPTVPSGTRVATPFTHYSLLRTSEEMLGITTFLGAAASAASMRAAFHA